VEIRVAAIGHVVVEDNIDALDVDAAAEKVRAAQDALFEVLEGVIPLEAARGWGAARNRVGLSSCRVCLAPANRLDAIDINEWSGRTNN